MPLENLRSYSEQLTLPGNRRIRAGPTEIEFRYQDNGLEFHLTAFYENVESRSIGSVYERPQWLIDIVTVGKVGGHQWVLDRRDPMTVLWFITDSQYNLMQFISPEGVDHV